MARRKLVQAPTGDGAILVAGGVTSGTAGAISRLTALDANHLHAWELDDASGDFVDTGASASKVNLTVTGTPVYRVGSPFGNNAVLFGIDSSGVANTNHGRALISAFADLPPTSVTVEAWVQPFTPSFGFVFGGDHVGSYNYSVDNNGSSTGQLAMSVNAFSFKNQATITAFSGAYGPWRHIALVYDGSNQYLYVDGEVVAKTTNTTSVQWSNGTTPRFCIARSQNGGPGQFIGKLCRVRLSNIARSQSYLRTVYATGMGF
jgi:hypothetical protein